LGLFDRLPLLRGRLTRGFALRHSSVLARRVLLRDEARMTKTLALMAVMLAAPALAGPLLGDAPVRFQGASLGLGASEVTPQKAGIGFGEHFGKTSAIGVASVTAGSLIGAGFASLGITLAGPVIGMLFNVFLAPIVTTLMAQFIGNYASPGRFGFWLPLLGAFVVNLGAFLLTSFVIGVAWSNPAGMLVYSLITGLLMSFTSVGIMHLTETKVAAPTITSFVPGVTDTQFIPLAKVAL